MVRGGRCKFGAGSSDRSVRLQMRINCIRATERVVSVCQPLGAFGAGQRFPTQAPTGKENRMELAIFLAIDVLASIALAAWLGANAGAGHSDWDR